MDAYQFGCSVHFVSNCDQAAYISVRVQKTLIFSQATCASATYLDPPSCFQEVGAQVSLLRSYFPLRTYWFCPHEQSTHRVLSMSGFPK